MLSAYTAAAVRAAEQPLLAAGRGPELMRKAAHGLAMGVVASLRDRGQGVYGAKAALLIGSGNNGGDALYAGAYLAARGARTTALLTDAHTHPEALAAFEQAGGFCVRVVADFLPEAKASDVIIDGLLGTGGRGGLREPAAGVVAELNKLAAQNRPLVVACDLPSGVDATTGEVFAPVLRADRTITFGAHKTGLLASPGEQACGTLVLIDLGLQEHLYEADLFRLVLSDLAALLPRPARADQKYTRGVAGIVAGSVQYPGAALLAVAAASACGPGMVSYLGPEHVAAALHVRNPEAVCSQESPRNVRVQAWLAGSGIDGDPAQLERASEAILAGGESGIPVVVDAAALELVKPAHGDENSHLVLTPHAGELATLLARHGVALKRSAIEAAPLAAARRAAVMFGAVVLLKGPTTVVAQPDGKVFTQSNGTPRLATAGSGDTLAGILVALLAMGAGIGELARTAALATALHGELASLEVARADLACVGTGLAAEASARGQQLEPLNAGMLATKIPAVWGRLCSPVQ